MKIPNIDKKIFEKHKVKIAYLFGSRVKGNAAPNSDYDLAVLFKNDPADLLMLKAITYLSSEINKYFSNSLDIVSLNAVSLLLKYEVVKHGQPIYCKKESERIDFEVAAIKEYIDDEPVRNLYNRALYKKILKGT